MKKTTRKKNTVKAISERAYNDIDTLPLWNFKKIIETKDLKHLLKSEKQEADIQELEKIWYRINDQLSEVAGVSPEYQKWILFVIDLENLRLDYIITGDRSLITHINIKIKEIERIQERIEANKIDFDKHIAAVELYFKFHIDDKATTVKRFFNYINLMKSENGRGKD